MPKLEKKLEKALFNMPPIGTTLQASVSVKHTLLSLSDENLCRIISYMREPGLKSPNNVNHVQYGRNQGQECQHSFIRGAFCLAQTCKRLYRLFRTQMFQSETFGMEDRRKHGTENGVKEALLLSPSCDPFVCLTPLLNMMQALRIKPRHPMYGLYHCKVGTSVREYDCEPMVVGFRSDSRQISEWTVITREFNLREDQVESFLQVARRFRGVRHLHVNGCPIILGTNIWTTIANAWHNSLDDVWIEDSDSLFDERNLAELARMRKLKRLHLWSQAVSCVDPLANVTTIKQLSLHSCLIHDHAFEPVLRCLKNLECLDISDTCITPRIARCLPRTLTSLQAGEQLPYRYRRNAQDPSKICFCVLYTLSEYEHLGTCEVMNPGPLNPRWQTKNEQFLTYESLPDLKTLEWGRWSQLAQGIASLAGVMASLEKLCLYGIDFNDEIVDMLPCAMNLKELHIYGCGISDRTAFAIGRVATLQSVTIINCPLITVIGLFEIADGEAARRNRLQSISLEEGHAVAPLALKTYLTIHYNIRGVRAIYT